MQLHLNVSDLTGDRRRGLRVSAERTIAQVRPQVLQALWPDGSDWLGSDQAETTWSLYNVSVPGEPQLLDGDRVGDVLQDGQEIRVEPTMTAGRRQP